MKKVLFLDADGVLNCQTTMQRHRGAIGIDPYMAFMVGKILLDTGADMVISSSWRHTQDGIDEIERQVAKSVGITPSINATGEYKYSRAELCERGQEIKAWLDAHPEYSRYAILDDENDMLPEQQEHFFKTSWMTGITEEVAAMVTGHLYGYSKAALERFAGWMRTRDGGAYAELKMRFYMDGEPYYASQGAEMSLGEFLRREKELTNA